MCNFFKLINWIKILVIDFININTIIITKLILCLDIIRKIVIYFLDIFSRISLQII